METTEYTYEAAEASAEEREQLALAQQGEFAKTVAADYDIADGIDAPMKLRAFDAENAKRDDEMKVALGKTDFATYMAQEAPRRHREREKIATAARSEVTVAEDQMNKRAIEEEQKRFTEEDSLSSMADYSSEMAANYDRHGRFSSVLSASDQMTSDAIKLIEDDNSIDAEEKSARIAKIKGGLVAAKAEVGSANTAAHDEIERKRREAVARRANLIREDLAQKAFASRYGFLKSCGKDDVTAFAMAKSYTRETVINHVKAMIGRGDMRSMLPILDLLEADVRNGFAASKKELAEDGKTLKYPEGKIDPRAGAYLTLTDIASLRKAAYQGLDDAINESKRKAQRIQDGLLTDKIAVNEKIDKHLANINLADGTVGMTNERRDAQYKEIWNEIKKLDDAGLDDAGALFLKLSNGTLARQKYSESTRRKLELEAARNKKAMTKAELQAQEARLKENIKRLVENPTAKEKVKLERKGEDGKPQVYEVEMSANEMIQMYIEIARMNDLCKGDEWTKIYKEHGNAERNLAIVNQVMNEMFEFPVKGSSYGRSQYGSQWGDRPAGSGTMLTFALADHAGVKCTNVYGEGMRVKTKQGNPLSFWGNEKPDWITGTVIAEMVAQGVKYLNDFAPADGQKAIEAIRQFWGESLKKARLEKDCTAMQNAMIRNLTQGLDYMRSGQVSGGMVGGKLRFAKGNVTRRQIHEMAMLTDIGQNVKTAQKNYNTAAQNYDIMLEAAKDNAAEQQYINGISLETE